MAAPWTTQIGSAGERLISSMATPSTAPLISGFAGGVVSTSLLLPLDIIKVRLQVNESSADAGKNGRKRRLGSLRVLRGIIRHEGIMGLYQGWTPAVVGSAVSWGGFFYFYEKFKRRLIEYKLRGSNDVHSSSSSHQATDSTVLNSFDNFALACTAGAVMVGMTNPVWLIKTRMQLQMRKASQQHNIKPYSSMLDSFRTIVREEGYLALYKGSGPALLLTSHGGVQFVVYESLKKHFHYSRARREGGSGDRSVLERLELSAGYLTMGAVAKVIASTTTYPLQVIKARMQQRSDSLELTVDGEVRAVKREYKGIISTARRIWRQEGIIGFWAGCIPNAIRIAPGAAVTFVVYESVMDWLRSKT